ncbi:MAG: molybdopterin molybdenumtransferase MoeA, partial [Saprospirales bacterium]|nr:molybdopterin molybdenumtransferase MoeA [Saprospirales bacterium]
MLTVEEATRLILAHTAQWGTTTVPFSEALGRILAEPISADRDFPPFTRVSMDGIAINYNAFANRQRRFHIQATQAAGKPPLRLIQPQDCIEVMTGAILPEGTDTVIRYEDLELSDGSANLLIEDIRKGQNAHQQGMDRRKGA